MITTEATESMGESQSQRLRPRIDAEAAENARVAEERQMQRLRLYHGDHGGSEGKIGGVCFARPVAAFSVPSVASVVIIAFALVLPLLPLRKLCARCVNLLPLLFFRRTPAFSYRLQGDTAARGML